VKKEERAFCSPRKPLTELDLLVRKPLTPQRQGVDTNLVKDKLLRILNPKLGNRPSQFDSAQKKTYSTEDLNLNPIRPLLNNGPSNPRQEAMSQLVCYNRLDEEEEQTETEKDEEEEALEQKRLGVLGNLQMNMFMFQKYIKWQRTHQVSKHPLLEYVQKQEKEPEDTAMEEEREEVEAMEEETVKEEEAQDQEMDQEMDEEEEEELSPQFVRRSSRVRKPALPQKEEPVESDFVEEQEEESQSKNSEEKEASPEKKGF